jgi:hypothetical protein
MRFLLGLESLALADGLVIIRIITFTPKLPASPLFLISATNNNLPFILLFNRLRLFLWPPNEK